MNYYGVRSIRTLDNGHQEITFWDGEGELVTSAPATMRILIPDGMTLMDLPKLGVMRLELTAADVVADL